MKKKCFLVTIFTCFLLVVLISCQHSEQNVESTSMKRRIINPWTWQNQHGFVQANEIANTHRMLFTAGIVSVDGDGNLLYPGDMENQMNQILNNMELLLDQADFKLSDVVRFTYYTTDIQSFIQAAQHVLIKRLQRAGCKPATSLIGVDSLFHPDSVIEIEAVAAK
jgi:2-iminobutanoate/2-iminopropanoate deaminase